MVIVGTNLVVADNSGAKKARCIKVLGGSGRNSASIGDLIVVSIKSVIPRGKVKKGEVYRAVIVRVKQEFQRSDGTIIKFDENAVILISKQGENVGTRVFGPVPRELRENYMKVISLAPEVL